jgi:hypothetical protein
MPSSLPSSSSHHLQIAIAFKWSHSHHHVSICHFSPRHLSKTILPIQSFYLFFFFKHIYVQSDSGGIAFLFIIYHYYYQSDSGGMVSPSGLSFIGRSKEGLGDVPAAIAIKRFDLDEAIAMAAKRSERFVIWTTV